MNDLDLTVTTPWGEKLFPNELGAADATNNVEQVGRSAARRMLRFPSRSGPARWLVDRKQRHRGGRRTAVCAHHMRVRLTCACNVCAGLY